MIQKHPNNALIPINLAFFEQEKTEKPTGKRINKARREGQVAKSPEVNTAFMFIFAFACLKIFGSFMYTNLTAVFQYSVNLISDIDNIYSITYISALIYNMFFQAILTVLPLFLALMAIGFMVNLIQVKWVPTTKPLKPKLSKLNPIKGVKKIFSKGSIVKLVTNLAKISVISLVVYFSLKKEWEMIPVLASMSLGQSTVYIGNLVIKLGLMVGLYFIFIAVADYAYQKYSHTKKLKMSKQEVKDEFKQSEGDPQIKGKIRSKMREASMRRMMQNIPTADVIITNPTHYAVALSYDRVKGGAPTVAAKGTDHLAQKIKKAAMDNDIEIVENKQLARSLYAACEVGQEIPPELYQAVAEVLAYVYSLKNQAV